MTPEQATRVVELRRAGIAFDRIARELGITATDAERVHAEALSHQTVEQVRMIELDRLDRMQQVLWPKVITGDIEAVDRAMKVSAMRLRLAGTPLGTTPMTDAYEATVALLSLDPMDAALVESGRWVVRQIDAAANSGDPVAESKAVFMVPHLVGVLTKLGATPDAREDMRQRAEAAASVRTENDLERFKKRRAARRPAGA